MSYIPKFGRIAGKVISCKIGNTANSSIEIVSRLKGVGWNETGTYQPQTVIAKVFPDGWFQGHKYVEGEVRTQTEIEDALYQKAADGVTAVSGFRFINPGADNDECKYFVLKVATVNQSGETTNYGYCFADPNIKISGEQSTVLWRSPRCEVVDNETSEWVYPFYAKFVVRSGA